MTRALHTRAELVTKIQHARAAQILLEDGLPPELHEHSTPIPKAREKVDNLVRELLDLPAPRQPS